MFLGALQKGGQAHNNRAPALHPSAASRYQAGAALERYELVSTALKFLLQRLLGVALFGR